MAQIFFSEINSSGGIAVYGTLGVKQYYGYTKTAAEDQYRAEAKEKIFYNKKGDKNAKNK